MSPERVLLIDDDDDIREIAEMSFLSAGDCEVFAASSGREGIALAESKRPDVVLLDVMMPGLDGPSTLQLLRASRSAGNIPVIFLTAKVQAADKRHLLSLGAHGIIDKPFDPLRLPDIVKEMLS